MILHSTGLHLFLKLKVWVKTKLGVLCRSLNFCSHIENVHHSTMSLCNQYSSQNLRNYFLFTKLLFYHIRWKDPVIPGNNFMIMLMVWGLGSSWTINVRRYLIFSPEGFFLKKLHRNYNNMSYIYITITNIYYYIIIIFCDIITKDYFNSEIMF